MADPLGLTTLTDAFTNLSGLITGTYVPFMVGAIVFGTGVGIGFRWLRRGLRTTGAGR